MAKQLSFSSTNSKAQQACGMSAKPKGYRDGGLVTPQGPQRGVGVISDRAVTSQMPGRDDRGDRRQALQQSRQGTTISDRGDFRAMGSTVSNQAAWTAEGQAEYARLMNVANTATTRQRRGKRMVTVPDTATRAAALDAAQKTKDFYKL